MKRATGSILEFLTNYSSPYMQQGSGRRRERKESESQTGGRENETSSRSMASSSGENVGNGKVMMMMTAWPMMMKARAAAVAAHDDRLSLSPCNLFFTQDMRKEEKVLQCPEVELRRKSGGHTSARVQMHTQRKEKR